MIHEVPILLTRLLKFAAICLVSVATLYIGLFLFFRFHHPLPPPATVLPSQRSDKEATAELNRRLTSAFPPGSKEAALRATLDSEGWGPVISYQDHRYVRFKRRINLMFVEVVVISWKSDDTGNVTEIHGRYFQDAWFKQG
jgi:hypothetical protein